MTVIHVTNRIAVDLTGIWISRAVDPADHVVVEGFVRPVEQVDLGGEVRSYSGGRTRAVFGETSERMLEVSLRFVPRVTYQLLLSWERQTLMVRDSKRRKLFGTFTALHMTDFGYWAPDENRDVAFQFQQVSFVESV